MVDSWWIMDFLCCDWCGIAHEVTVTVIKEKQVEGRALAKQLPGAVR